MCAGDCGASSCQLQRQTLQRLISSSPKVNNDNGVKNDESIAKLFHYLGEERTYLDVQEDRVPFSVHELFSLAISSNPSDVYDALRRECIYLVKQSKETFWVGSDWKYSFDDEHTDTDKKRAGKDSGERRQSLCQLEDLALMIFHYHTKLLSNNSGKSGSIDMSRSGAEWWIQVKQNKKTDVGDGNLKDDGDNINKNINNDETVCLHYDKDEVVADVWGAGLFPPLSTITYLTNSPQPTLIFNTTANDMVGSPINDAYLSFPRVGKHVSFEGDMLHGAPSHDALCNWSTQLKHNLLTKNNAEDNEDTSLRVTFLVNIWLNHHPQGVDMLNEEIARSLKYKAHEGVRRLDAVEKSMEALHVSFMPPPPPNDDTGLDKQDTTKRTIPTAKDYDVNVPLTTLVSLQSHGTISSHNVILSSDEVYAEEMLHERDENVCEDEVLLQGGYEQLCLPFISSKYNDAENDGEENNYDEPGLSVRMILPPFPGKSIPVNTHVPEIPIDNFHFTYSDEMCAPAMEYDYYDDDDDGDGASDDAVCDDLGGDV